MSSTCSVVVADDNRDAADSLVALLCEMVYPAIAAYDGREAVQTCSAMQPELAILDVQMPLLDGCAAARLIRLGAHPPRTIVSLSALRHWDEPMKSQGSAFDLRLAKPVRMGELNELLARVVGLVRCDEHAAGGSTGCMEMPATQVIAGGDERLPGAEPHE